MGKRMGLQEMRDEQSLEVASIDEQIHLSRLRELSIMAMESIETGEVEFTTMSEVLRALQLYANERRLVEGEPTERKETNLNISLGGKGKDTLKAVEALLAIASSMSGSKQIESEDVIDVTVEDDD